MARAFHRKRALGRSAGARARRGVIEGQLDVAERALLRSLFEQTRVLLESVPGQPDANPESADGPPDLEAIVARATAALDGPGDDPALQRLLPDGHRDDPLASAEFRRRSAGSVRHGKLDRIEIALACLDAADEQGRIQLEPNQAGAFVVALTDVRLVLGQRLGLHTEEDMDAIEDELAAADDADPRVGLLLAYDFTTWLQEGLSQSLLP